MLSRLHSLLRQAAVALVPVLICLSTSCGGGHPPAKAVGIDILPRSASAWADSNANQVTFTVSADYSDGHTVPLTSGITWSTDLNQNWLWIDASTATATCKYSAPQTIFFGPEPATVTAETTIESQAFSNSATVYCF